MVAYVAGMVLCLLGVVEFVLFVQLALRYAAFGVQGDENLYFGVGRGLLNGLRAYTDLFETKPPVVFWLSALSLWMANSDLPYRVIEAIGLGSIPAMLAGFTARHYWKRGDPLTWVLIGVSFLFGASIVYYVMNRGEGYQTEGFGIVPAIAAILIFANRPHGRALQRWQIIAIAGCLALAVLTKEPFALAVLGGFIPLVRTRGDVWQIAMAGALGIALWIVILAVTGNAQGYFSVYLPEIASGRIAANSVYTDWATGQKFAVVAPLWLKAWNILRLYSDMRTAPYHFVAPLPFLALALSVVFLAQPALVETDNRRWKWGVASAAAVSLIVLFANLAFALEQIVRYFHFTTAWSDSLFREKSWLLLAYGVGSCALLAVLAWHSRASLKRVGVAVCALLLASIAVATGGEFYQQHFLFAVPVYAGAFVSILSDVHRYPHDRRSVTVLGVLGCLLALNTLTSPFRFDSPQFQAESARVIRVHIAAEKQAKQFDAMLTACHLPRYLAGSARKGFWGLTVHSPYQLPYGTLRAESQRGLYFDNVKFNDFLHAKLLRDFAAAPVIVLAKGEAFGLPDLLQQFQSRFETNAPSCAKPYLPIENLAIYFRVTVRESLDTGPQD